MAIGAVMFLNFTHICDRARKNQPYTAMLNYRIRVNITPTPTGKAAPSPEKKLFRTRTLTAGVYGNHVHTVSPPLK